MKRNVLVTLADAGYIDQAKQLFSSVYWNAGWDGDYLLLAHDIPEEKLVWFRNKGIGIYHCGSVWNGKTKNKYPATVFSKFFLFKDYFKQWEKVLYLDGDIIVNYPLEELKKIKGFGAKADFCAGLNHQINFDCRVKKPGWEQEEKIIERLSKEYDLSAQSFNSGVMVIDTDLITSASFDELITLMKKYTQVANFGDQLVLNLFMYRKWFPIADYYNAFTLYQKMNDVLYEKRENIPAIHFLGPFNKPWHKNHRFYEIWKENLRKADGIDLEHPQKSSRSISSSEFSRIRKIVEKNEWPFVKGVAHYHYFYKLDVLYEKKEMKEFRRSLVESIRKKYMSGHNRYIPYYFISFIPIRLKLLIKKALFL